MTRRAIDDITQRERESIAAQMAEVLALPPYRDEPEIVAPVRRLDGTEKRWQMWQRCLSVYITQKRYEGQIP